MNLKDFITDHICPNSLIRLWTPLGVGKHQMIYKEDGSKPNNVDDVCMEWELLNDKVWQSKYKDCKVIGVNGIAVKGFYTTAINIVIDENIIESENPLKTYIVKYAPLNNQNHYSLQEVRTAKILSKLPKDEVKKKFEERCDSESSDIPTYQGVWVKVQLLEEYLDTLPTDTI